MASPYTEPYDQLDLNVAYNLTPDWTLTASVINATKSEQRVYLGKPHQGTPDLQYLCSNQLLLALPGSSKATPGCPGAPVQPTPRPWRGRSSHGSRAAPGGCRCRLACRSARHLTLPSLEGAH